MLKKIIVGILFLLMFFKIQAQSDKYEIYFIKNQYDSIKNSVEKKIYKSTVLEDDYYWYSKVLEKQNKQFQNIKLLKEAINKYPNNEKLYKMLAKSYFETGNYKMAFPMLKSISNDDEACKYIAKIYEFKNKNKEAINIYDSLLKKDTCDRYYLKKLSDNYYVLKNYDKAVIYYKKILSLFPQDQISAYYLSKIYQKQKHYNKSINVCLSILKNDSLNKKFIRQLAISYYNNMNYQEAVKYYKKCLFLGDTTQIIYKKIGKAELENKNILEAKKYLLFAYNLDTNDFKVCYNLYKVYYKNNEYDSSVYFIEKAEALLKIPDDFLLSLYYEKANLFGSIHQYEKQINTYKQINELNDNFEQYFNIAYIYQEKIKNKKKAIKYYEKFIEECDKNIQKKENINTTNTVCIKKVAENRVEQLKKELFFESE